MAAPPSLLARTNALLVRVGFPNRPFDSLPALAASASSMLVAVFEAIIGAQVEGVRASPGATVARGGSGEGASADYAHNAQRVVDMLSAILPSRVSIPASITGVAVAEGDLGAIAFLVSMLDDLSRVDPGAALGAAAIASAGSAAAAMRAERASSSSASSSSVMSSSSPRVPATTRQSSAAADVSTSSTMQTDRTNATAPTNSRRGDIWASATPAKLRERSAVQTALVGGPSLIETLQQPSATVRSSSAQQPLSAAPPPPPTPTAAAASPSLYRSSSGSASSIASSSIAPPPVPSRLGASASSPRSAAPSTTTSLRISGGPGSNNEIAAGVAAEMAALDERRRAAAAAMTIRRQQSVISRLAHAASEEMSHIANMTSAAVRSREAEFRLLEAKALRAATARAKAAKHERKVIALRTRVTLEDMSRHTLSMRITRSSKQAAAASSLLKALAVQARASAAEAIKAAAAERIASLSSAQSRVAWLNHTARVMNEAVLEETARQVAQRQAATRSQKEALDRAIREMKVDDGAVLAKFRADQDHAEAAFLATHVEAMDVGPGGGSRAAVLGGIDGKAIASERLADGTDTDNDPARVLTLDRLHRSLGKAETARGGRVGFMDHTLREGALEIGATIAAGDAMAETAAEEMAATGRSGNAMMMMMRTSSRASR